MVFYIFHNGRCWQKKNIESNFVLMQWNIILIFFFLDSAMQMQFFDLFQKKKTNVKSYNVLLDNKFCFEAQLIHNVISMSYNFKNINRNQFNIWKF